MKIIEDLLLGLNIAMAIMALSSPLLYYIISKRLVNNQKEDIKEEILDYLSSKEGQQSIANLGLIFGSGIAQGVGLKGKVRGGKIFGIPIELVQPFIDKFVGKKGNKVINEEPSSSSSDPFAPTS